MAVSDDWDPRSPGDLRGRTYLVTGSTAGLGYFACEQLARAGAHVIMTGRNPHKMVAAKSAVLRRVGEHASVETLLLDTSKLGSVRAAAATIRGRGPGLDGILLNAGLVHTPKERETTNDGHEVVLATNALGHFALAGELLTTLSASAQHVADPRLVWVGSISTSLWKYDPIDPELVDGYTPWRAYVQSKVATAALGFEADRRLRAADVPVASVVAHPGYSIGGRTAGVRGVNEPSRMKRFIGNLQTPIAQSKEHGAYSLVRALVDPKVQGGQLWGPRYGTKGGPIRQLAPSLLTDEAIAARLWAACEKATGVTWRFDDARW